MDYNNIKNEKSKQLISLYKGNIFDKYDVKYFGVLNGLLIGLYLNKNNINNIPYNIIHILKYHKINKCEEMTNPERPYGVVFLDINGDRKLVYVFQKEKNRNNWYKVTNKILIKNKSSD
eukprot:106698_1